MKSKKTEKTVAVIFLAVILFFFLSVILRTFARQVLEKRLGISNAFTDIILYGSDKMKNTGNNAEVEDVAENDYSASSVNWEELYPFSDGGEAEPVQVSRVSAAISKIKNGVSLIESGISYYATDLLPGYAEIVETSRRYSDTLQFGVDYVRYPGSILSVGNNFLININTKASADVSENADSTIKFAEYCEERGIDFVFFQQPVKCCKYDDIGIDGVLDFTNESADRFLELLNNAGVRTYDHRADIHSEGLDHHSLFYNTDHHWRAETGLWASQHILRYLNSEFGYDFDESVLDPDNYTYELYPEWMLGSTGKRATLSVAQPEDFTLIHPKFETSIHYEIPSVGIDEYGDFDITYNMLELSEKDYYNKNTYGAYNHGDRPLVRIENLLADDGPRLLIVHTSFANCEIPFLAMGVKYVDAIDLRHFTGSLKAFIEESKPDIVIVTYAKEGQRYSDSHTYVFNFD